ncbi:DUF6998 domain-containing protein [Asticcacaulis biprosthecium]|uniref:DUF6998 domain-containing protein n=1 Tax=Asticcacaulis biprosthecium TaxID=76891 RepID=UPI0006809570|nr:hypothetical protein [Asticcacaulis biprosthecium]
MLMTSCHDVEEPEHWQEVQTLLDTLYSTSARLEASFPGRKFTLDGHLVGSVSVVIASYMFDLSLEAASTPTRSEGLIIAALTGKSECGWHNGGPTILIAYNSVSHALPNIDAR